MESAGRALFRGLIDYAGLYPPAAQSMDAAVREFAAHRAGPAGWALHRFVVPARRLEELGRTLVALPPEARGADPWRLSATLGEDVAADSERVEFFADWLEPAIARVESVETVARTVADVERVRARTTPSLELVVELPSGCEMPKLVPAVRKASALAKLRTGGARPDDVPGPGAVLGFLEACAAQRLAFKATAGLHHAVRGPAPLTYEPDAPRATVFGYLNVFLAAIALWQGRTLLEASRILEEQERTSFQLSDGVVGWRDLRFSAAEVREARRGFATTFGSCSFSEPLEEARALGLATEPAVAGGSGTPPR
jgi:hypothetical protein